MKTSSELAATEFHNLAPHSFFLSRLQDLMAWSRKIQCGLLILVSAAVM